LAVAVGSGLDRVTVAEYNIANGSNEVFTIDDVGNRDMVNVRDGNKVSYVIDASADVLAAKNAPHTHF